MTEPLLSIEDLRVAFRTEDGDAQVVNGIDLEVGAGEAIGIVGESGSGKSLMALAVLRLITSPNVRIEGSIRYRGTELLTLPDRAMRGVRGKEIAMVFQDPMTSFTPVYTIGWHLTEMIQAHEQVSRSAARARAIELLAEVGIADPRRRVDDYPLQMSGGMRQRAMIAMAIACGPALLIADEPTTALDVTIQAQILDLLRRLRADHGSAVLLISHDLGVVAEFAEQVRVMYAGRVVEQGTVDEVLDQPAHPYTWGLLDAVPRIGVRRTRRLPAIPGTVASPLDHAPGCAFAPRCRHRHAGCEQRPPLAVREGGHADACCLELDGRAELRAATAVGR